MKKGIAIRGLLACLLITAACSKKRAHDPTPVAKSTAPANEGPAPRRHHRYNCDDLVVEVEGKRRKMVTALAYRSGKFLGIQLVDHEHLTCKEVLAGYRRTRRGEVTLTAAWSEEDRHPISASGGRNKHTVVSLLRTPQKVGDEVALCLSELVTFDRGVGQREITVSGLLVGRYCGERKKR